MSYGNPEINNDEIKCDECGNWYKKLTYAHMQLHGLTIPEYKKKWGLNKNQPLEAFYIKTIRINKTTNNGTINNLTDEYRFRKGHKARKGEKRPQQELNRLQKYNDRKKEGAVFLSPEEIATIFDLYYKLKYPKGKIGRILYINEKTVTRILKKEKLFKLKQKKLHKVIKKNRDKK